MREILFRGKEVELKHGKIVIGEWIKGFYYNQESRLYIKNKYVACPHILVYDEDYGGTPSLGNMGSPRFYRVLPETIGQYIGIADKNGTKIFDGDIVKTKTGRLCKVYWFNSPNMCGWDLKPIECNNPAPSEHDLFLSQNLEVVGNIHDNFDLVRGVI